MTAPAPTSPPQQSPAERLAEAAAVVATYQASTVAVRGQLEGFIRALWASLGQYRAPQMREFTGQVLPVVQGAMGHMADLTSGYLAAFADTHGHPAPPLPSRAPTIERVRNGADPTEVYERPFHLVWRQLADLPHEPGSVEQAIGAGEDRAVQTALTDVQLAKTHTAQQSMTADRRIVGYRRELEGAYSCGLCIVASTIRYHKADLMPVHPACVLSGTLVSVPAAKRGESAESGPIKAATRRRYDGEGVVLRTASGNLLTVTPNHPVLTVNGWIPAGLLREGDEVVSSTSGERVVGRVPHEYEVPTLVEDRFRALSVDGLVAVPLAAEDFHGDVPDRHVGVVPPDGLLWDRALVARLQLASEMALGRRVEPALALAGGGYFPPLGLGMDATTAGLMGSGGLSLPLLRGHAPGALLPSGGSVADLMARLAYGAHQGSAGNAVLPGDVQSGRAVEIAGDRSRRDHGSWAKFDAPASEFGGEGLALHAERGRSLLDRLSGEVQLDRLVFVGRVDLSAHVYNLQTAEGFYSANGIIVSNCDCQPVPLYADEQGDWQREADARLASAHQAIADKFGTSSAGARGIGTRDAKGNPLSYKDALVTHEHGEIGPVLAVKYRPFTGPGSVKNGKAPGSPAKPTPKTRAESTPEQRASMARSELAGLERNLSRLTNDKQRAWTQQRIDLLRKQLG